MNTKTKIRHTALKLFNNQGVEKITTRHIAQEMGISQGNLHYHYPNKNELINALFQNFLEKLISARKYNPDELFKKEDVFQSMTANFKIMYRYRFIFTDNEIIWRRIPSIKNTMIDLLIQKKNEIKTIIRAYINQKIFRSTISDAQIEFLSDQFIFTISTWLNASEYLGITKNKASYFTKYIYRHWIPYLTEDSMKEWETILK